MNITRPKRNSKDKRSNSVLLIILVLILSNLSCDYVIPPLNKFIGIPQDTNLADWAASGFENIVELPSDEVIPLKDLPLGDASSAEEPGPGVGTSQEGGSPPGSGELKPVGFVNYGEFNATVRAWTYVPLGVIERQTPSEASTVSSANTGSGTWPNTSRFISVPMGFYTWCIDWEEGDLDEDGNIDYFHYIDDSTTLLDENDSDELEFAEEVAISAPPATAAVYKGKCKPAPLDDSCVGKDTEFNVSSYYALEQDNPPEIFTYTYVAENPPTDGIQVSVGGVSTAWGDGMILWQAGDWVQTTTSNPYTAIGGQIHGDKTIGWARALFDGNEIWRGDTSTYTIAEGRYGVYVEVRCFPPGSHTLRIEALGNIGSGGGMSIPVGYFGFRP